MLLRPGSTRLLPRIARFAVAAILPGIFVDSLIRSPFDGPAAILLFGFMGAFFLFSFYVLAMIPLVLIPRRCPECGTLGLWSRMFYLTQPLGGIRQCRLCGVFCAKGWSGPWVPFADSRRAKKSPIPVDPFGDEIA